MGGGGSHKAGRSEMRTAGRGGDPAGRGRVRTTGRRGVRTRPASVRQGRPAAGGILQAAEGGNGRGGTRTAGRRAASVAAVATASVAMAAAAVAMAVAATAAAGSCRQSHCEGAMQSRRSHSFDTGLNYLVEPDIFSRPNVPNVFAHVPQFTILRSNKERALYDINFLT